MTEEAEQRARDWAGNVRACALVWGVPSIAIIAGSLVDVPARTAIWTVALIWMGSACLVNSRRCGRTHQTLSAAGTRSDVSAWKADIARIRRSPYWTMTPVIRNTGGLKIHSDRFA